jgi:hypothetical protein
MWLSASQPADKTMNCLTNHKAMDRDMHKVQLDIPLSVLGMQCVDGL